MFLIDNLVTLIKKLVLVRNNKESTKIFIYLVPGAIQGLSYLPFAHSYVALSTVAKYTTTG